MRIIGLDVGSKTIGVAVSDALGWTAQGITTIKRRNLEYDLQQLQQIIDQYEIGSAVVGLPLNMNGSRGESAQNAEDLGKALSKSANLDIYYQDERLTTVAAQRLLIEGDVSRRKRKDVIDKVAATLILQCYLDRRK